MEKWGEVGVINGRGLGHGPKRRNGKKWGEVGVINGINGINGKSKKRKNPP